MILFTKKRDTFDCGNYGFNSVGKTYVRDEHKGFIKPMQESTLKICNTFQRHAKIIRNDLISTVGKDGEQQRRALRMDKSHKSHSPTIQLHSFYKDSDIHQCFLFRFEICF